MKAKNKITYFEIVKSIRKPIAKPTRAIDKEVCRGKVKEELTKDAYDAMLEYLEEEEEIDDQL